MATPLKVSKTNHICHYELDHEQVYFLGFPKLISHKETDETAEFIINVSSGV